MHLVLRAGGLSHTVARGFEEFDDVDELFDEVVFDFEGHGGGGVGGHKVDGMLVICFLGLFDLKCVFCI
tara:strand:+ start:3411 stop:3617 length:207 start_codon:yes stop_codon:yes gene_type:complete